MKVNRRRRGKGKSQDTGSPYTSTSRNRSEARAKRSRKRRSARMERRGAKPGFKTAFGGHGKISSGRSLRRHADVLAPIEPNDE